MNERIRQLVLKAGGRNSYSYSAESRDQPWKFSVSEVEKFAELIVRECAELAKHHVMNISTYADAEFVDQQIKEHFGVA